MLCDGKIQCMGCPMNTTCSSSTRVFVNYCGSTSDALKDQIHRARIECRVQRRLLKYGNSRIASRAPVQNAFIVSKVPVGQTVV